jgi:outer membrane protein assembly factor BamD
MRHARPVGLRRALLGGAAVMLLGGCGAAALPSVHSEPERFALARRLAAKGDYVDAIELLKTYSANNAGAADVDQAVYLLGQCYLATREFASASVEFERLLREYPESDSSGAASFRLGQAYFGQSRPPDFDQEYTHKALDQWRQFLESYPDHWLAPEAHHQVQIARMRLATKLVNAGDLYVKLRYLAPARAYYHKVEDEYADLPQLGQAWVGLARCDALEHNKADAIARLKQVEERFAGRPIAAEAAHERARLSN